MLFTVALSNWDAGNAIFNSSDFIWDIDFFFSLSQYTDCNFCISVNILRLGYGAHIEPFSRSERRYLCISAKARCCNSCYVYASVKNALINKGREREGREEGKGGTEGRGEGKGEGEGVWE